MREQLALHSDTVDVADVIRTLKRQWRAVITFLALGVAGALAVVLFAPKRYDGKATVLVRSSGAGGASVRGRMTGGISELLDGVGGELGASSLETELQVLRSRALAAQVIDSLQLQFSVREPAGVPPGRLIQSHGLASSFGPRKYRFERGENGTYRVIGDSVSRTAVPGQATRLEIGAIVLAATGLPNAFTLRVFDREDAVARFQKRLEATKAGGEVAKITYRGEDKITAAAVPNAVVNFYLERRKTVDRGANQRRVEFVTQQVDQTSAELTSAERELRRYQESTGVFDAEISDKAQIESAASLRASLIQLQVDEGALSQLLAQADKGLLSSRDVAAYPSFIRGSSVSPLAQQLSDLEMTRTKLLERRTERDPEVMVLDTNIKSLNAAIIGMARSYLSSVSKQRKEFQGRLDTAEQKIVALPAANERVGRLRRDVLRLTQLYTALQAQLVEAKLAAIGEGGEVRQIDVAEAPRDAAFPEPFLTMGLGTAGGLVAGIFAALFVGWFGRWLRDPMEIERLTGITAERFQADAPLLVASGVAPRTVLVIPLDARAQSRTVAERLARTASARSRPVTILDFSGNGSPNGNGNTALTDGIARQIERMESEGGDLVVQLPTLWSEATIAALRDTRPVILVAPPGPVDRTRLTSALETLRRMQIPCAGIVLSDPNERAGALL